MFLKVLEEFRNPTSYTEDYISVMGKDHLDTNIKIYKYPGGIIIKKFYPDLNGTLFQSVLLNTDPTISDIPSPIGIINSEIGLSQSENQAYSIPRTQIFQDPTHGNLETVLEIKNLQIFSQIPAFYSLFITDIENLIIEGYPK